jgi:hypothetical protein
MSPDRNKDLVLCGILVHHGRVSVVKTEREGSNLRITPVRLLGRDPVRLDYGL